MTAESRARGGRPPLTSPPDGLEMEMHEPDAPDAYASDAEETYVDKVSGRVRRRRGHRGRVRRGPYSAEEDAAIRAFDMWLSAERKMNGVLAQPTCTDIATFLTRARIECERYSYENVPDVSGVNPHVVFEEMDIQPYSGVNAAEDVDDEDVYDKLR